MNIVRTANVLAATFALTTFLAASGVAAGYPEKPVRIIVPTSPGGGTDTIARFVGQRLSEAWGQPVVIENRPGAGGTVGTESVARGRPDGYTLLMHGAGHVVTSALKKTPYDPIADFTAVTMVTTQPYMLVVHPSVPVSSAQELVSFLTARPGLLNYASSGEGGPVHLATELFQVMTGTRMVHVPYKGVAPAQTDVLAGHVQLMFTGILPGMPHVKAGKLKALAVTSSSRSAAAPQLQTVSETVAPGYEVMNWFGLFAPPATPASIVNTIQSAVAAILREPQVAERLRSEGLQPGGNSPIEFERSNRAELAKWKNLVKQAGIRIEQATR
jgi:tripartite-type tricarboxylate transporter receptor subunit TctC